jgi:hypothetical protein
MNNGWPGVTLHERPDHRVQKGVNGLDSGCGSRGSVPRKATMISKTMRRKKISATNTVHASKVEARQGDFALAA